MGANLGFLPLLRSRRRDWFLTSQVPKEVQEVADKIASLKQGVQICDV
jgi:ABC-type multidrug transport system ATPase subunit